MPSDITHKHKKSWPLICCYKAFYILQIFCLGSAAKLCWYLPVSSFSPKHSLDCSAINSESGESVKLNCVCRQCHPLTLIYWVLWYKTQYNSEKVIRQGLRSTHHMSPGNGWKWKWPNGVGKISCLFVAWIKFNLMQLKLLTWIHLLHFFYFYFFFLNFSTKN